METTLTHGDAVIVAVPEDHHNYPVAAGYRGSLGHVREIAYWPDSDDAGVVYEAALVEFPDGRSWYVETKDLIAEPKTDEKLVS